MKNRKWLSVVLCLALLLGGFPARSLAAEKEVIVTNNTEGYEEKGADASRFKESGLKNALGEESRFSYGKGDQMVFTPDLPQNGTYEISVFVVKDGNNSAAQKVTIHYKGGSKTVALDFLNKEGWIPIGTFPMDAGKAGDLTMTRDMAEGEPYMRAGGAKFVLISDKQEAVKCDLPDATVEGETITPVPTPTLVPVNPKMEPKPMVEPPKRSFFGDLGTDVAWAKDAVELLAGQGVIKGKAEGVFDPNASITRAEFVTLAVGLLGSTLASYTGGMADVVAGDWYADYIQTALNAGLIDQAMVLNGHFYPNQAISREEMTSIMVPAYETLSGKSAPEGKIDFSDQAEIAPWAKEDVASAVALGMIKGVGDHRFAPQDQADRAQAAVIIDRLLRISKAEDGIYLSTSGSDSAAGSLFQPVATLKRAVALAKEKGLPVFVFAGTYQVDETVMVDSDGLSIQAFESQSPVFSAGVPVTGWTQKEGNIYQAKVEGVEDFRQVYVDGLRAIRARYPNEGSVLLTKALDTKGMLLPAADLKEIEPVLKDFTSHKDEMELSVLITWMHKRLRISDLQDQGDDKLAIINPVEFTALTTGSQGTKDFTARRYWLENAYEFIDQPYEWYYDKAQKMLYLHAPDGVDLNSVSVVVPKLDTILKLQGTAARPVKNITLDGITFQHTGWTRPNDYGFVDVQANSLLPIPENDKKDPQFRHDQRKDKIPGAISADYASDVDIRNCVFAKLGGNGVTFDLGGENVTFDGNVLFDISGNGFEIGNDASHPSDMAMVAKNVAVRNNYIENVANEYMGGLGILVYYCESLVVSHNHLKNLPYSGMSLGWGWGNDEFVPITHDFTVTNNRIERYSQVTNDSGGIYSPNPTYGTNLIQGNYIIGDYHSMTDKMLVGIYHDASGANWTDTQNVIENVPNWVGQVSGGSANKSNIQVYGNYVNQPLDRLTLTGDQIEIRDNAYVENGAYDEKARSIMDNAGLSPGYVYLQSVPGGDLTVEVSPVYLRLAEGETGEAEIALTNRTAKAQETVLSAEGEHTFVQFPQSKVLLQPGERRTVKAEVSIPSGMADAFYLQTISAQYQGRKSFVDLGVNKNNVSANTVIYTFKDQEYKEEAGKWADSGLTGYDGTKSRYGYENGAAAKWTVSQTGRYRLMIFNIQNATSARDVTVEIRDAEGVHTQKLNQRESINGWVEVGEYTFGGSAEESVKLQLTTTTTGDDSSDFLRINSIRLDPIN